MEWQRARTIMLYWQEGELTAENYLKRDLPGEANTNAVGIDPLTVEVLSRFDDWVDSSEVGDLFPDYSPESVSGAVETLVDCGLLQTRGTVGDEERFLKHWKDWGNEARFFHFATKDADYVAGDEEEDMEFRIERREAAGPPPALFKVYPDAPRLYLTRSFAPIGDNFGDVLLGRRTHRQFTGEPVDQKILSTLLFYTFSPMLFCDANVLGTVVMKTSPSGGARHELEAYIAVFDVEGIPPGLYHYCAENHSLELLSSDFDRAFLRSINYGMAMPSDSAFVWIVTAIFWRTMWKYAHSRNYRVTLLGAGHIGQTFALTATALGLGPWQTIVFRDTELERALGIDGYREGVLYMFGAGHPVRGSSGLPSDLKLAGTIEPNQLIFSESAEK